MSRSMPPNSMDSDRSAVASAMREYRADAQRCLLGLAYALARAQDRPALAPAEHDDETPIDVSAGLELPDPGGWPGALAVLLDGPAAQRLACLELDAGVVALAEVGRLERAEVGPERGILRRAGQHSPAWQRVRNAVAGRACPALLARVIGQLEHHGQRLSPAMCQALVDVHDRLAGEGVALVRLFDAALPVSGCAAYMSLEPAAVQGAPGWGVHLRIEPTVDGAWMLIAQRVWTGTGPERAAAPGIAVTVHTGERELHGCIERGQIFAMWYEEQPLGHEPRLSACCDKAS